MIDDCFSFLEAADHLKSLGVKRVYIIASHGILSGDALEQIEGSHSVHQLITTNTIPVSESRRAKCKKLKIIDISLPLAEGIRRVHNGESISYLFHTTL